MDKLIRHNRDKQYLRARPIVCSKCGQGGGTLVKVGDDKYIHEKCPKRLIKTKWAG